MALNQDWFVRYEELHRGPEHASEVMRQTEGWLGTQVPCDVHMPLIEAGIIPEPLEGLNSFACEWTQLKSWWFKTSFQLDPEFMVYDTVELSLESLDAEADVFLNGRHIGHHRSAFYPFTRNVREALAEGDNSLWVRVTSGVEHFSDMDTAFLKNNLIDCEAYGRGDPRRTFVRKPQYGFGWDWGPKVPTCGIMGEVTLTGYRELAIRGVRAFTKKADVRAELRVEVELESFLPLATTEATIAVEVLDGVRVVLSLEEEVCVHSGVHFLDLEGVVEGAKLWWPNGMGDPHLYEIRVAAKTARGRVEFPAFRHGIRSVRLLQDRVGEDERLFAIEINGVRAFCKGANWIPADSIHARVSDGKYATLIGEAREAQFNMLRVWGGGLYERDAFYRECDENGIMVWQDFMFACGLFPDHLAWFRKEAEAEMDYQTRRLRNHPSLVLWCGDNEDHWAIVQWTAEGRKPPFFGGATLYNELAPRAVRRNCPDIPYWNGSPYGGAQPNDHRMGDVHHWHEGMMSPDMEKRIAPEAYDRLDAKFVSEYGYVGPCRRSSIEAYHGGSPLDRDGDLWKYHNNFFEKDTVAAGVSKHYIDAEGLSIDEYLHYAGVCQGLMYGYSLESFRYKERCSGGLFWMYNDCWGEVGWSIIDYYATRKIAYYYVKRAFDPIKLIIRREGGVARVIGINETPVPVRLEAEAGYVSFDGQQRETRPVAIELPAHSRGEVLTLPLGERDYLQGTLAVIPRGASPQGHGSTAPGNGASPQERGIAPATLRTEVFRKLRISAAELKISSFEVRGDEASFTVSSDTYAHAVHFRLDDRTRLSDEYFDLLPGESRQVTVYGVDASFSSEGLRPTSICRPEQA
ncbi:glycoside hydrolase family 2 protein [Cohnella sp. GCM10012308]|uniref:beta-mannosidase n=1 Tax=Cohnella sp. GCM10012308 TaxID=3317329 RepID=UPI00361CF7C8